MATSKKIPAAPIEHHILVGHDGKIALPKEVAARLSGRRFLALKRHPDGLIELLPQQSSETSAGVELLSLEQDDTIMLPERFTIGVEEEIPFSVTQRPDSVVELRSLEPRDPSQWWYWTERWQQMEREADEDIAAGRVRTYDDAESFLADLDADLRS